MFTPKKVIDYQERLGADIIMSLDQCLAYTDDKDAVRDAMERTHRWAEICREAHSRDDQALFGIVQGGVFEDLREESASYIKGLDFPGYAIGGLAVGEPKSIMYPLVEHTAGLLPEDKPRYLMGVGSPEDLVHCVARGVDMFDCALPTRVARNGALFTRRGRLDIRSAAFRGSESPVEDGCDCYTCTHFTAGYLHHLFKAKELLGLRLATIHNLRFVVRLMADMRAAIAGGSFDLLAREFSGRLPASGRGGSFGAEPETVGFVEQGRLGRAAGDCRNDAQLISRIHLRFQTVQEADVLTVEVDVDEIAEVARLIANALLDARMLGIQRVDRFPYG